MVTKVLFICSANMCRSPMGEGYMYKRLFDLGIDDVEVQSAAVYYSGGNRATEGARHVGKANDFNLEFHVSQFMDPALYKWADKILVMTRDHVQEIGNRFPDDFKEKVHLLATFDPDEEDTEVQDPYGSGNATYESVFRQIKRSVDSFIDQVILPDRQ